MQLATIANTNTQTMSSREISELTGKGHNHVMRDIRKLEKQLGDMFEGYIQNWTHPKMDKTMKSSSCKKTHALHSCLGMML